MRLNHFSDSAGAAQVRRTGRSTVFHTSVPVNHNTLESGLPAAAGTRAVLSSEIPPTSTCGALLQVESRSGEKHLRAGSECRS